MQLKTSHYGLFYGCTGFYRPHPEQCLSKHGAHPDGYPLGIPANAETRALRVKLHPLFDALWNADGTGSVKFRRTLAYRWLAREIGYHGAEAHIGDLDAAMCLRAIAACEAATPAVLDDPDLSNAHPRFIVTLARGASRIALSEAHDLVVIVTQTLPEGAVLVERDDGDKRSVRLILDALATDPAVEAIEEVVPTRSQMRRH